MYSGERTTKYTKAFSARLRQSACVCGKKKVATQKGGKPI